MIVPLILRGYAIIINLLLLIVMGADKRRAIKGLRRVPEADLFLLALMGGSIGGVIGMLVFRHKTQHAAFAAGFPILMIIQVGLAMWLKLFILL